MLKSQAAIWTVILFLGLVLTARADDKTAVTSAKIGETLAIPYRLSDVKHVVVRIKINNKGPFNFIVDTGAPAVYLGNEVAKKLGLETKEEGYWQVFDSMEVEGGLKVIKLRARVEEPFQLKGINKMNAAGMPYHGVLGYSVLSQFQIEYDFTQPHMKWTRLDWTPPPPVGMGSLSAGATSNMKAMVGLSMFATSLMPKKSDPQIIYRGMIGIELEPIDGKVIIARVLPNTPASRAELKVDDQIVSCNGKPVQSLSDLQKLVSSIAIDQELTFEIVRGSDKLTVKLTAARGF